MVFTLPLLLHRGSTPSPPLTPANFFPSSPPLSLFLSMRHLLPPIQTTAVATKRDRSGQNTNPFPEKHNFFGAEEFLAQSLTNTPVFPEIAKKYKGGIRAKKRQTKNLRRREGNSILSQKPNKRIPFLGQEKK